MKNLEEFKFYPSRKEIDIWTESIWDEGNKISYKTEYINYEFSNYKPEFRHLKNCFYIKFSLKGMNDFYAFWQPSISYPAPLLVHVPGYGAEMSYFPNLVFEGFNVLHITPLGYVTPYRANEEMKKDGHWPVLPDTILSHGKKGYRQWFINCIIAIRWALKQKEVLKKRISFFGTSQGGGCSLILGSIFKQKGVRCIASDLPFLTNFPVASKYEYPDKGAYSVGLSKLKLFKKPQEFWHTVGFIDTVSHVHRLNIPVMLTSGGKDPCCPPETIFSLFEKLPGIKLYYYIPEQGHEYTQQFITLAKAWFRLYA